MLYDVCMKVYYNLRMDDDLKANLEEWAKEEGRSLNNLINHLLKCAVVSNGIIRSAKAGRGKIEASTILLRKEKEDGQRNDS